MSARVPPLAERSQPGLSETLRGPVAPDRCQGCGADPDAAVVQLRRRYGEKRWKDVATARALTGNSPAALRRWIECDAWDRKTSTVVVLCPDCSDAFIEPHPRLYHPLSSDAPHPGCMSICVDCVHRDGTRCTNPRAKANGGPGVMLHFDSKPSTYIACGTQGGHRTSWRGVSYGRITACRQKEPVPEVSDGARVPDR